MIKVRRAVHADRAGIASVRLAAIRGLTQGHYSQAEIEAWCAGKKPELYPINEHLMFVASRDDEVVGFSELRVDGHEVRAVYVSPDLARQGVGSQLLGAVESAARDRGLTVLQLGAALNALEFYKRHGFRETGARQRTTDGAPYQPMAKQLVLPDESSSAREVDCQSVEGRNLSP